MFVVKNAYITGGDKYNFNTLIDFVREIILSNNDHIKDVYFNYELERKANLRSIVNVGLYFIITNIVEHFMADDKIDTTKTNKESIFNKSEETERFIRFVKDQHNYILEHEDVFTGENNVNSPIKNSGKLLSTVNISMAKVLSYKEVEDKNLLEALNYVIDTYKRLQICEEYYDELLRPYEQLQKNPKMIYFPHQFINFTAYYLLIRSSGGGIMSFPKTIMFESYYFLVSDDVNRNNMYSFGTNGSSNGTYKQITEPKNYKLDTIYPLNRFIPYPIFKSASYVYKIDISEQITKDINKYYLIISGLNWLYKYYTIQSKIEFKKLSTETKIGITIVDTTSNQYPFYQNNKRIVFHYKFPEPVCTTTGHDKNLSENDGFLMNFIYTSAEDACFKTLKCRYEKEASELFTPLILLNFGCCCYLQLKLSLESGDPTFDIFRLRITGKLLDEKLTLTVNQQIQETTPTLHKALNDLRTIYDKSVIVNQLFKYKHKITYTENMYEKYKNIILRNAYYFLFICLFCENYIFSTSYYEFDLKVLLDEDVRMFDYYIYESINETETKYDEFLGFLCKVKFEVVKNTSIRIVIENDEDTENLYMLINTLKYHKEMKSICEKIIKLK